MDWFISGVWKRRLSKTGESLYRELDVSRFAGETEIDNAYQLLSARYHTEALPGNEEVLQTYNRLTRAHKILKDGKKKAIYDEYGSFGLHIAERYGEEELETVSVLISPWFQLLTLLTCCFGCGCCCCCFCCDGCCGLCIKDSSASTPSGTSNQSQDVQSTGRSVVSPPIITRPAQPSLPDDSPVFVISGRVERDARVPNDTYE